MKEKIIKFNLNDKAMSKQKFEIKLYSRNKAVVHLQQGTKAVRIQIDYQDAKTALEFLEKKEKGGNNENV